MHRKECHIAGLFCFRLELSKEFHVVFLRAGPVGFIIDGHFLLRMKIREYDLSAGILNLLAAFC